MALIFDRIFSMVPSRYLNPQVMDSIDPEQFRAQTPFPWVNPQHFIVDERFRELLASMPEISRFGAFFGKQRQHGQASHDRYVLDYEEGMALSQPWAEFIAELRSDRYRRFVCRLLGVADVRFRFHWHFTPDGGEVSPHCDSSGKIGSQIFYLNTVQDWEEAWGGATVVLDDGGRFRPDSAPAFEEFLAEYPARTTDNRSLLFGRRGNSWHGVHRIDCPEGYYRKVFIVVFEERRPLRLAVKRLRRLALGKPLVTQKERVMY
jgi:hypothetical protein